MSSGVTLDEILEALRTSNRINLLLFDAIDDDGMACTLSTRGGRDVLRQFAHLVDVRRYQIEGRGKKLGLELPTFPAKAAVTRAKVREALVDSGEALEVFFEAIAEGKARSMKKGPATYMAYFVAHDAHHRGNILLTLKQCGHAVDKDVRYALWDWDRR